MSRKRKKRENGYKKSFTENSNMSDSIRVLEKNGRKKKFVGVVTLSITTLIVMTLSIINYNLMTFNITLC